MPTDALSRLRLIRDVQRKANGLTPQRDRLIQEALREGKPARQIAEASGLSPTRVHEIGDR